MLALALVATVVPFFLKVGWFIIFGFLGLIMGFKYPRPLARGDWVAAGRAARRAMSLSPRNSRHRRLVWAQRQYFPGRHHRDDLALLWAGIGPGWRQ